MITVLTPTYNRANLLNKAYQSLTEQTDDNFEWIVVDDGSTDKTKNIVEKFINEDKIRIRYYYKKNGGKHTALNLGINKAKGNLLIILDSDDYLDKNAVKISLKYWEKYKDNKELCGMMFLKKIDNPMYKNVDFEECISNMIDFKYNKKILSDMCEVMRIDILKKYPYPVFENERFLSEVVVTGEIGKKYNMAYIPKIIYYAKYLDDGLSRNWMKLVVNNPLGARANNLLFMSKEFKFLIRLKNCIMFDIFSIIAHKSIYKETKMKFFAFIFYIPSWIVAKFLIMKYKQ